MKNNIQTVYSSKGVKLTENEQNFMNVINSVAEAFGINCKVEIIRKNDSDVTFNDLFNQFDQVDDIRDYQIHGYTICYETIGSAKIIIISKNGVYIGTIMKDCSKKKNCTDIIVSGDYSSGVKFGCFGNDKIVDSNSSHNRIFGDFYKEMAEYISAIKLENMGDRS